MTEDKKKLYGMLGMIPVIIGCIWMILKAIKADNIFVMLSIISGLITFAIAMAYAGKGYKKNGAGYYKAYMVMFAVTCALGIVPAFMGYDYGVLAKVVAVAALICALILAFWKDLGKTKSYVVGIIATLLYLILFVSHIFAGGNFFDTAQASFTGLLMSLLSLVFISAKYADKSARGRKI